MISLATQFSPLFTLSVDKILYDFVTILHLSGRAIYIQHFYFGMIVPFAEVA